MPLFSSKNARELELLSAYLDGRLNAAEKSKAERLLSTSPEARALLSELRATTQVLRQAPHAAPRRSFAVRADMLTAPVAKSSLLRARLLAPVASAAAAGVLALSLVGGAANLFTRAPAFAPVTVTREAAPTPPSGAATQSSLSAATAAPQATAPSGAPAPQPPAAQAVGTGSDSKAGGDGATAVATPSSLAAVPTTTATPTATPAPEPTAFASAPLELITPARHFPWLPIEIAAGLLTVLALGFTFWVYRVRTRF